MSAWRARALELFPEMRPEIQAAESVGMLWTELSSRFQQFYTSVEQDQSPRLIRNICMYAIWCTRSDSADTQQAAWIEFYENIPRYVLQYPPSVYKRIIRDLVANLGIAEIEKSAATIYLSKDQIRKFSTEVEEAERER